MSSSGYFGTSERFGGGVGSGTSDVPIAMAVETDARHLPTLLRTPAELAAANQRLQDQLRLRSQAGVAGGVQQPQQQIVPAPTTAQHLVDIARLDRDLQPLEALMNEGLPREQAGPSEEYNFHERIVADAIGQSLDTLRLEGDRFLATELDKDWSEAKRRLLQDMGLAPGSENIPRQPTAADQTVVLPRDPLDDLPAVKPRGNETPKMTALYNAWEKCKDKQPRDIVKELRSAAISDTDAEELWGLIEFIIQPPVKNLAIPIMAPWPNSMPARAKAARVFLEQQSRTKKFKVPGEKALQSMKAKYKSYELIFNLCRMGAWDEAVVEIEKLNIEDDVQLRELVIKMSKASPVGGFIDVSPPNPDPFRQALVSLADFDYNAKDQRIAGSVEDFLWLKLCAVTVSVTDREAEAKLRKLIASVKDDKHGPDYFNAGENPFFYARVLATCADVEGAIDFLATFSSASSKIANLPSLLADPLPDAVHMAITLRLADRLMISAQESDDRGLNVVPSSFLDQQGRLQYRKLMWYYAKQFSDPDKEMAYVTSTFPKPPSAGDLAPARKMLSRPAPSGGPIRLLKVLKQYVPEQDVRKVAFEAANEPDCRPVDAVKLLLAAAEPLSSQERDVQLLDRAAQIINKELARVMNISNNKDRAFWASQAQSVKTKAEQNKIQSGSLETLKNIVSCVEFYDDYAKGDENAPVRLEKWLFPSTDSEVEARVDIFPRLDAMLIDAFPGLVSATVECCSVAAQRGQVTQAKERLKRLVDFIAALRIKVGYRLRSDVEKELVLTESRVRV